MLYYAVVTDRFGKTIRINFPLGEGSVGELAALFRKNKINLSRVTTPIKIYTVSGVLVFKGERKIYV